MFSPCLGGFPLGDQVSPAVINMYHELTSSRCSQPNALMKITTAAHDFSEEDGANAQS